MNKIRWFSAFLLLLLLTACGFTLKDLMRGGEVADELQKSGWTPVDFPREILGPGSIVSITDTDGIRYRGYVDTCIPGKWLKIRTSRAALPSLSKTILLKARAFLKFNKVAKLQPDFKKIKSVKLKIGNVEEITLDELLLSKGLDASVRDFDKVCRRYFLHPRVFIITSALQVTDYTYTIYGDLGFKIELSLERLKTFFDFAADVKYEITSEGSIKVKDPLVIAFKTAKWFSLTETPLARPDESAMAIMTRYYRLSGAKFGE